MYLRSKRKLLSVVFVIGSSVMLLLVFYNGMLERLEKHVSVSPDFDSYWIRHPDDIVKWTHPICKCSRSIPLYTPPDENNHQPIHQSNCGPAADTRGPKQRVVSFAFYGDLGSDFFKGIARNAKVIPERYPGWVMRLYHDVSPTNKKAQKKLCKTICDYPFLDDCYIGDLKSRVGHDLKKKFKMLWRLAPLGDPLVDIFTVRDLDSTISQREMVAVNEWLTSNKTWHVMRDHPGHTHEMLGGGWGVKNTDDLNMTANMLDKILKYKQKIMKYGFDQFLLAKFVYPEASKSLLAHDSYNCMRFNDSVPFPTQRHKRTFVFDRLERSPDLSITVECPIECRPENHKDWIYC